MRHRELDLPRADTLGPFESSACERHPRLRPAHDLDLAPGEADSRAERLADRLLAGEASGVVLCGVRAPVAVGLLGLREAAVPEAGIPLERLRDPRDLDQ